MDYVGKANAYIRGVLSGKVDACRWVQAACQRQKDDLSRWKKSKTYRFNASKANEVCAYIEAFPHVKGKWATENLVLEPWQCFLITTVFGWQYKDPAHGWARRFNQAYIEVPRKNGKSPVSAGVGNYMATKDGEPGAEVYSAATTRDQARIVFNFAREMSRKVLPLMREKYGWEIGSAAPNRSLNMHSLKIGSKFEPLSADHSTLDGLSVHCGIVDEFHAHASRGVYDVLESAIQARRQPLIWMITTAGSNRAGICYEIRTYVTKILEKSITVGEEEERFFGIIYTIDDGDDWADPEIWEKANPNWGVSVDPKKVAAAARKAIELPSAQNNFLTKYLNVWVNADTAWMPMRAWDAAGEPGLVMEDFAGMPCWMGLDVATRSDLATLSIIFKQEMDGYHRYVHFLKAWLPEDAISESNNSQYPGWERSGHIIQTPGPVTDLDEVEEWCYEIALEYKPREFGYDEYNADQLAQHLVAKRVPMVKVPMTTRHISEPMKTVAELVVQDPPRFVHDANPVMTWCVSNVVGHLDRKDNIYPRKERHENKIDGAISCFIAMSRALLDPTKKSAYSGRGPIVVNL